MPSVHVVPLVHASLLAIDTTKAHKARKRQASEAKRGKAWRSMRSPK